MNTLAFFPWFSIAEPKTFGQFDLIPYDRDRKPGGVGPQLQSVVDAITRPYVYQGDYPIRTAALLKVGDGEVTRHLSEDDVSTAFAFAELLACAGLAGREFFSVAGILYSNRDAFRLSIQHFQRTDGPTTVVTRRRDGSTKTLYDDAVYRVHKPKYVECSDAIDEPLLEALLSAQAKLEDGRWAEIYEAVFSFNLANTDGDLFSKEMEVVLTISAFERLAGTASGRERDLALAIKDLLIPVADPSLSDCTKLSNAQLQRALRKGQAVREIWIRDMFRLRGHLAHGRTASNYPSIRSINEHLLLASYAFPLVLKRRLTNEGLYSLTKNDNFSVFAFEKLAATDMAVRTEEGQTHPWQRTISDTVFEFPGGLAEEL
jgi:hypothetical protein